VTHPAESISAYLDGELDVAEQTQLFKHLSSCGRCSAELADIQRVRAAVRSLPILDLPVDLVPESDPNVVPLHRNRGILVGAAAAIVALVIAVAAAVTPPAPSVSVEDLSSRFGARVSLDPAFGSAKVVLPEMEVVGE
jgi:anti-sigma factor RsiW